MERYQAKFLCTLKCHWRINILVSLHGWLFRWLHGWLFRWLYGWLFIWLYGWLSVRFSSWFSFMLAHLCLFYGWMDNGYGWIDHYTDQLIDWLIQPLIEWLKMSMGAGVEKENVLRTKLVQPNWFSWESQLQTFPRAVASGISDYCMPVGHLSASES